MVSTRGDWDADLDCINGIHDGVFLSSQSASPGSSKRRRGVNKQLSRRRHPLPCSAPGRSWGGVIRNYGQVSKVSLRERACTHNARAEGNTLIVLHGLGIWLGHLGHSFNCSAVGLGRRLKSHVDDVCLACQPGSAGGAIAGSPGSDAMERGKGRGPSLRERRRMLCW